MPHTEWKEPAASTTPVLVSDVIGAGEDAHRLAQVGEWHLTAFVGRGDDEPRVRDMDLAARLGFARLAKIRDLIKRHAEAGNITPLSVFTTVVKSDGKPHRVCESWLSEADALFITSQSSTKAAVALTKEMIRVYMLARRGLLPQSGEASGVALSRISDALVKLTSIVERTQTLAESTHTTVQKLEARVVALESRAAAGVYPHGVIGRHKAREIHGVFQAVADLSGHERKSTGWYGARRRADMETRQVTSLGHRAWAMLDANDLAAAWNKATELRGHALGVADARRQAERDARQRTIWDAMPDATKRLKS